LFEFIDGNTKTPKRKRTSPQKAKTPPPIKKSRSLFSIKTAKEYRALVLYKKQDQSTEGKKELEDAH